MLLRADARRLPLVDVSVDCIVTSPPYWGLRDYGVAEQIGLESTPEEYVRALVAVFREGWRVLKPGGTCWLNLGDTYATAAGGVGECPGGGKQGESWKLRGLMTPPNRLRLDGFKPKDLVGVPWRVAFALQADGWYLRSDIIWSKPNPMPESVTDRPTKAHEYLFLLAKSEQYYYDAAAIGEAVSLGTHGGTWTEGGHKQVLLGQQVGGRLGNSPDNGRRNKRSVWTVNTQPYNGAHFATMPEALVEPCILAGCPLGGLVLDPFIGSGTTGAVATRLGRRWAGVDLTYQDLARERTAQRGLLFVTVSA